eukprot:4801155-Pleurochrysis_carterae.AAC.1
MVELESGLYQGDGQLQVSAFACAEPAGRLVERVQLNQVLLWSSQTCRGDRIGIGPALIRYSFWYARMGVRRGVVPGLCFW